MRVSLMVLVLHILFSLIQFRVTRSVITNSFLGALSKDYINIQWFIAWDFKSLAEGFFGYWNTPFYAPLPLTLGFGDHVPAMSALVYPVFHFTKNSVLCYNLLFLAAFALTGWLTFQLFFHLTKNEWAAFLMSFAYAFAPFRFALLDHAYVLTFFPTIFMLLFAHRYVDGRKTSDFVLSYVGLAWQILSGMNMGLFAFYSCFFFWLFFTLHDPSLQKKRFFAMALSGHLIAGILFLWQGWPNLLALKSQGAGWWRWGDIVRHSATLGNYLSVPITSLWSQPWMEPLRRGNKMFCFFPGLVVLAGCFLALRAWRPPSSARAFPGFFRKASLVFLSCSVLAGLLSFAVHFLPAFQSLSMEKKIQMSGYAVFLLLIGLGINSHWREQAGRGFRRMPVEARFYLVMTVLVFLFTFSFFYKLLHVLAPGFGSVRVPGRMVAYVQLGLCVLGAYGISFLLNKCASAGRKAVAWAFLFFICVCENLHSKIPADPAPALPSSHVWLGAQTNIRGIMELPFPKTIMNYQRHSDYVYWTTHHWKPTVHGYSSVFPNYYHWLSYSLENAAVPPLAYLQALEVSHVVCHWNRMTDNERVEVANFFKLNGCAKAFASEESDVYLVPAVTPKPEALLFKPPPSDSVIRVSIRERRLKYMMDEKIQTAWKTGRPQREGDWVQIDLKEPVWVSGVRCYLGKYFSDFPRNLTVEGYIDGNWRSLAQRTQGFPTGTDFRSIVETPGNPFVTYAWPAQKCSSIKMTIKESGTDSHWSVADLRMSWQALGEEGLR